MADSAVAITAGSGTNIDTRTEGTNSNHRQVIVIGDPATNDGVAPVDQTLGVAEYFPGFGTVGDGRKTVTTAGTREQFTAQACKKVIITAETDNTNEVVIGGSTVVAAVGTRQGIPLFPAQSEIFHVNNMNLLYIDSVTNGEGVTFVYFS